MVVCKPLKGLVSILVPLLGFLAYELFIKLEYSPVVETSSGSVRGYKSVSRLGKEFYQFLGLPYAQPPVGKLRFSSPRPVERWEGVRDAVRFGNRCMQVDGLSRTVAGDEDCLTLNIFVPKNAISNPSNKLLPVIFYIHGGYFMIGGSAYMGPDYLLDENVILVTLNYRLNVFGFLNTQDATAPGNFGLKDQNLALKWTVNNIRQFGGDSKRITLAGQSAGSVAVHLHMLSPMSKGMFSGVIMSSGTAIKPWSLVSNPRAQATNLAKQLDCSTSTSMELVECLRSRDPYDIVYAQLHALSSPVMDPLEIFAPSVESCDEHSTSDCFLPLHPYDILQAGNASRVPMLTGVNSEEGLLATTRIYLNGTLREYVKHHWEELSPNFFCYDEGSTELTNRIRQFYLGTSQMKPIPALEKFQNITNAFSDRLYIHATRETVKIQSKFSPVYLYYFTYPLYRGMGYLYDVNPSLPILPQFVWKEIMWYVNEYVFQKDNLYLGVGHGDDIALIFKFPVIRLRSGSRDFHISRQMVKLWTDFATNPTKLTFASNAWPPVPKDATTLQYMQISKTDGHGYLIDEPFAQRMRFWDKVNLPWKL